MDVESMPNAERAIWFVNQQACVPWTFSSASKPPAAACQLAAQLTEALVRSLTL